MYTNEEFERYKIKVMKFVLYKKRTEYEIRNKFKTIIEENMLEDIINYLIEAEYINDNQYVEKAINNFKILNNLSLKEVRYKLLTKGLNKNIIEDYIYNNKEELEEYEIKSAQNIYYKKSISLEKDEIIQFLLKKGYRNENIQKVIENE